MTKEENPEYFKKKRELAENEAKDDLTKSKERIFTDIHDESLAVHEERPPEITIARTMARFAALLVRLSKESSETADKNLEIAKTNLEISRTNLRFQKGIIWLTVIILILTFFSALPVFQKMVGFSQGSGSINQKTNAPP